MHARGLVSGTYGVGNVPDVTDFRHGCEELCYTFRFAHVYSVFTSCCTERNSLSALIVAVCEFYCC